MDITEGAIGQSIKILCILHADDIAHLLFQEAINDLMQVP